MEFVPRYSPSFFILILSPSFVGNCWPDLHRYGSDDVSKVTLPAWPGQGYGRHRLSSDFLVPFVFLSILGYYFALCMIWIYVLYICILDSFESLWLYIFFCGFLHELV
jgi:hypothetical protein